MKNGYCAEFILNITSLHFASPNKFLTSIFVLHFRSQVDETIFHSFELNYLEKRCSIEGLLFKNEC
jgi:hypothetical protein